MKIVFLGTGTSTGNPEIGCQCEVCTSKDPRDWRLRASILVETEGKRILIDCGPDFRWQMITNKIYYFDKNGYMQTGWKKYKNSWYYLRKSGKNKGALCTGWKTISGKRYFLAKKTGARVTGWHTIKN